MSAIVKKFTQEQIKDFWDHHTRFLQANLVTESPHPETSSLSYLCQTDLASAFIQFKQIELECINKIYSYTKQISYLQNAIQNCLKNNNNIFLVGCGASGRLAMLLKRIWELYNPQALKRVICVSSAGDTSLIKSVEQFEDRADFGIKQLILQGYSENDLVIGLSASGESPFILAAVKHAAKGINRPWLIFNNPIESLLERNPEHILAKDQINYIALDVGPMALTGSTRLQATTAMQIAVGIALCSNNPDIYTQIKQIHSVIEATPVEELAQITNRETEHLLNKDFILYNTDNALIGLSLLADITERAPTFNLIPFENLYDQTLTFSPFYLSLSNASTIDEAWQVLLGQAPTCLGWEAFPATSRYHINGFDLSNNSLRKTAAYLPTFQHTERWLPRANTLIVQLDELNHSLLLPADLLQRTLVYKLYLNSHSTLMMGRLAYFDGNMMLSLKPSNYKLIDRAIRYSQFILDSKYKIKYSYKTLADIIFEQIELLEPNQSIVTNVVNFILATNLPDK